MFMKKSNITGWKDVFSFTLVQTLKSKAYIVTLFIFIVIALASMPLMTIFTSDKNVEVDVSPITSVYVFNNTALPMDDFSSVLAEENLNNIKFTKATDSFDSVLDHIEKYEKTAIALNIKEEQGTFLLSFVKAKKGSVKEADVSLVANAVQKLFEETKINSLGIDKEQLTVINSNIESKVNMVDTSGIEIVKEDTSITNVEYIFIYGLLFIIMMVNTMASSQIATSVVSDKSTKVIEYLLTSVKPLAIIVGKVLAMLSAVLIQVLSTIILFFISNQIATVFLDADNILEQYISGDIMQHLNPINILLCVLLFALGMIFYATLAGLAGATVSRIEEASESLTIFTVITLVGVYIGIGAVSTLMGSGLNVYVYFSLLFPLSSPFILPGAILIGKANLLIIVVAIVLQIISIALLFRFVAKVYETLILHNGNKIGIKELFKISKAV